MDNISIDDILLDLGQSLRSARKKRKDTQEIFRQRLGLSRQTVARMEKGDGKVALEYWLQASEMLNLLHTWDAVLSQPRNLFEELKRKS